MDTFVDNADVLREIDSLRRSISDKNNVRLIDVHSFEFVLLSFHSLIDWVFAEKDNLREVRSELIRARELIVEQVTQRTDNKQKQELEYLFPYVLSHNTEQAAAELLYQITRNTGFETSKGKLGNALLKIAANGFHDRQMTFAA